MFSWGIDSISRGPPRLARYRRAFLVWIPALLALMLTGFFSAILATFEGPWRPVARRRVCLCMVALIAVFLAQLSALLCSAGTVVASGFGPMAFGRLLDGCYAAGKQPCCRRDWMLAQAVKATPECTRCRTGRVEPIGQSCFHVGGQSVDQC
jgi:hypothetical protein